MGQAPMAKTSKTPVIWQLSVTQLIDKTLFSGVILKKSPSSYALKTHPLRVISPYFIHAFANQLISIQSDIHTIQTHTDKQGGFWVVAEFEHKGEINIYASGFDQPLKVLQSYPILFHSTQGDFNVISDIDDTIIVSHTADRFKRVRTLIFKKPKKRTVIDFTQDMFNAFATLNVRVFYISKSESNLFRVLSTFITHNNLPKGKLFLTPYLKFYQLLHPKKDINFKIDHIKFLIEHSGKKKYVLFGDDSQRDIAIYTETVKAFPQRILKVYIRKTRSRSSKRQKQMLAGLEATGIPFRYFRSDDDIDISKELNQLKNSIL